MKTLVFCILLGIATTSGAKTFEECERDTNFQLAVYKAKEDGIPASLLIQGLHDERGILVSVDHLIETVYQYPSNLDLVELELMTMYNCDNK